MAKKQNAETTEVAVEGAVATSTRGKKIMLTDLTTGEQIARADYIKARFAELGPQSRGTIVKELAEKFGHVVPYQIVFAATKAPKAAAPVEAAPAEAAAE